MFSVTTNEVLKSNQIDIKNQQKLLAISFTRNFFHNK